MNKKIIVIPQKEQGLVVNIEADNTITLITKIEIPYKSISHITDNKKIVTLDQKKKELLFYTYEGQHITSIPLPFGRTMNVRGNIVYVGGNSREGEVLYMIDASLDEYSIKNLELPEAMARGKAIDDIVFLENKMYLIDNIVSPKYTFVYDIENPAEPKWLETISLSSYPNEHIHKGDVNKDWLVYFSRSSTRDRRDYYFITIKGKERISLSARYYYKEGCYRDFTYNPNDILGYLRFIEIFIIKNILYVLTDIGLVFCDLSRLSSRYTVKYGTSPTEESKNRLEPFKLRMLEKPIKQAHSHFLDNVITFIEHDIHATQLLKVDDNTLLLVNENEYELIELSSAKHVHISPDKFWEKTPFVPSYDYYNQEKKSTKKSEKKKKKTFWDSFRLFLRKF